MFKTSTSIKVLKLSIKKKQTNMTIFAVGGGWNLSKIRLLV